MFSYKTDPNKCINIEIIEGISSNYKLMKLNQKKGTSKFINRWKLNNTYLNNKCIKEEITREISKYLEINENK